MLKVFKPFVSEQAKRLVLDVLNSDQLAEGAVVKQFESQLSEKLGFENILTVNSGTSALELAYQLAGIKSGDEVIVPVLTCTATNIPLVRIGANIVFADVEPDLNVSITDIKKKITDKTKAIVFVHFGGNNRGLAELKTICIDRGILLIEDAAQAIGSDYWGVGDFTAVSLQAIKTLTSGDGGLLICKDKKHHDTAKKLRWFGYDRDAKQNNPELDLELAGYKFHMNNITASIGLGNLEWLESLVSHRKRLGEIYKSYGMFSHVWLAGGFTEDYRAFKQYMSDKGYEIAQHHYRNDTLTVFKEFKNDCPVMDTLEGKYFFVPMHHGVTEEQAHEIGKLYKEYK